MLYCLSHYYVFGRLYDPRVPELLQVLHREVYFPSEKFSDPKILDTLVSLGLKRNLDFSGFLDCARSVSILNDSRDLKAPHYGRKLLALLDALSVKLSAKEHVGDHDEYTYGIIGWRTDVLDGNTFCDNSLIKDEDRSKDVDIDYLVGNLIDGETEDEFWSHMKAISWCPICPDPPLEGLPWLKSCTLVACPDNIRPKSQMLVVSATMHILDGECSSLYLLQKLGWMDRINIDGLSTQLIELSKSYGQCKLHSTMRPDFDGIMQKGIPNLYSKLQEFLGTDDFLVLRSALNGVSWVWIGDDFVSADALAFDSPVKFTPYLYVVPSELSEFRELLTELGVRFSFDVHDYLHVLKHLEDDMKGFPLSSDQLSFVHRVLEAVADCYSEKPSFDAYNISLLIPDFSGILVPVEDLVYKDAPWVESTVLGKHFVHSSIGNDLANRLGVKSLRCISLVDEEMTKNLPCMDSERVKELLQFYGNSDFLLFDLLELADCCKAKKLHLIFDKREHARQTLLQHNLGNWY